MLRKRCVALLLAMAVLCGALAFSVSAENEQCAITIYKEGNGSVSVDGTTVSSGAATDVSVGATVELTAEPNSNYEFLFWQNHETLKVVSWEPTYTFTAATYALYDAVFARVIEGYHTIVYLTKGENVVSCQTVPVDDTSFYDAVPTSGMAVSGKVWTGWDKKVEDITAIDENVIVRPLYDTDTVFSVDVTVDGTTTSYEKLYLSHLTLNAPTELNGEPFSYWLAKAKDVNSVDEITSFFATYEFVVTGNVTLEAVYGETVSTGITTRITGDLPSREESTITICAERSVTDEYTVVQHGILITKDMQIGSSDSLFVIPSGTGTPIKKFTAGDKKRAGSYRINLGGWNVETVGDHEEYPRVYARSYVIAKDSSGVQYTIYSARYCADYVLETGSGGSDNYDDPFG